MTATATNINPITGEAQSLAVIGTDAERERPSTERSVDGKTLLVLEPGPVMHRILDARDAALVTAKLSLHARASRQDLPRVGEWLDFESGVRARAAHVWADDELDDGDPAWTGVQPDKGGRWYLGEYACSFSGSLAPSIPLNRLTLTSEQRAGACWIFHHDYKTAHNGVDLLAPFRVWAVSD